MGNYHFGNDHRDGYQAKSYEYKPEWEKDVDFNPDHYPSATPPIIEPDGASIRYCLPIRGLGVIILRGEMTDHEVCEFKGVSIFTKADIGYSPKL